MLVASESSAFLSRPGACHPRARVSSLPLAQSDLSSFPFPLCFCQPELTCQSLANSGHWWDCPSSLSPQSGGFSWHLAPSCFLVALVTSVPEPWQPSECLGKDQPGHKIHLRIIDYDQAFENATNGFQAVSESV